MLVAGVAIGKSSARQLVQCFFSIALFIKSGSWLIRFISKPQTTPSFPLISHLLLFGIETPIKIICLFSLGTSISRHCCCWLLGAMPLIEREQGCHSGRPASRATAMLWSPTKEENISRLQG